MFTPIPLNLPPCSLQLSTDGKNTYVVDLLRKKKLVCTPEEWVRQHWIHFLINEKNYPKALISCESGLKMNGMPRRSDLVIYNTQGQQILLGEFKSPHVKLGHAVVDQVLRYNAVYQIPLILVSNGLEHGVARIHFNHHEVEWLSELPAYMAPMR